MGGRGSSSKSDSGKIIMTGSGKYLSSVADKVSQHGAVMLEVNNNKYEITGKDGTLTVKLLGGNGSTQTVSDAKDLGKVIGSSGRAAMRVPEKIAASPPKNGNIVYDRDHARWGLAQTKSLSPGAQFTVTSNGQTKAYLVGKGKIYSLELYNGHVYRTPAAGKRSSFSKGTSSKNLFRIFGKNPTNVTILNQGQPINGITPTLWQLARQLNKQ